MKKALMFIFTVACITYAWAQVFIIDKPHAPLWGAMLALGGYLVVVFVTIGIFWSNQK